MFDDYFITNIELLLYFSYRFKTKNYFKTELLSINIYIIIMKIQYYSFITTLLFIIKSYHYRCYFYDLLKSTS